MQIETLGLIIGIIVIGAISLIWLVLRTGNPSKKPDKPEDKTVEIESKIYTEQAKRDAEHIFDDQFREELKNHGRLYFEKIINENAMFLQQDLRLTTSQLNDFMKQKITDTLQEEFSKYERSIEDAKKLALESLDKTRVAIEQQRQILGEQLEKELRTEKERLIGRFENNMAEIINHYVVNAIGNQIDLNNQLEYILGEIEANKESIAEDIRNGT